MKRLSPKTTLQIAAYTSCVDARAESAPSFIPHAQSLPSPRRSKQRTHSSRSFPAPLRKGSGWPRAVPRRSRGGGGRPGGRPFVEAGQQARHVGPSRAKGAAERALGGLAEQVDLDERVVEELDQHLRRLVRVRVRVRVS